MKRESKKVESMSAKEAEFAILKVAFLLTAIDGRIDDSERAMFDKLVERCREVDVDEAKLVLASVDSATKRMLKATKQTDLSEGISGVTASLLKFASPYFDEERLKLFMDEVDVICDWNVFARDSVRVRRAFVMWLAMVKADGDYSVIELKAIKALQEMVNSYKLIDDEFLAGVEDEIDAINRSSALLQSADTLKEDRKQHDAINDSFETLAKMIQG